MTRWPGVLLVCSALPLCAQELTLTITSDPDGAFLTELSNRQSKVAPVTLKFDGAGLNASRDTNGCFVVAGATGHWVSGASTERNRITLCGSESGTYIETIRRDPDAPRLDEDVDFAKEMTALRTAGAASDQTLMLLWAEREKNSEVCVKRKVGDTVSVRCK